MLKATLALFFGCIILNTVAAYGNKLSSDLFTKRKRDLYKNCPYGYDKYPPKLLDDDFMATKIPSAQKPFIVGSYVLLHENNDSYLDSVKKSVGANWQPPLVPTTAIVSLEINKSGEIANAKMLCPSGNPKYDQSALKAVLRTGRFAPPSKDLRLPVLITLTFNSDPRLTDKEWASSYLPYCDDRILIAPIPIKPKAK